MTDFTDLKRSMLAKHLRQHLEGEVRFDLPSRNLYSTDASIYQILPLGVVIPRTVQDLVTTVQVAAEMQIPITARGGGTSLSGQSIGPGVVIDCSKYLHQILDIDPTGLKVRVQPGVILDQLNRALEPLGLQFGPDVATATRANLGGMIGNNSAGARSVVYGKTIDHVRSLKAILADGREHEVGPLIARAWEQKGRDFEGNLYRSVRQTVLDNLAEISKRFPRILRRVSGYNLDVFAAAFQEPERPAVGLHQLIVGSEGTLGVVTEAELALVHRPKVRGLVIPHFASLAAAMDAVQVCLDSQPSAVELMDQMLLDLARENLGLKDTMTAIQGRPAAVFMVEFSSDESAEVVDRAEKLERRLKQVSGVTSIVSAHDPVPRNALWNLRIAAVPLLLGIPGDQKPTTFVEDTAVAPERLPEFVARFKELLHRHDTDGSFYGHASVGCLHIRPVLNLKDKADVVRMRKITEDVTDLVLEFNGALSGEHGDGLARSEWNRKMFGERVYEAFRRVKRAFDPGNLFNPGKVVDAPSMTDNLRYGPGYAPEDPPVLFDYTKQEGFVRSIELCNGSGVCRRLKGGTMCPSFRATLDEKDSTRGRANALRLALAGEQPIKAMQSPWVHDVLDLCLMCKACKSECPSNVDMTKLKAEFLHFYHQAKRRPALQRMMADIGKFNAFAARFAPLANFVQRRGLVRWFLDKFGGIDRRRSLPALHRFHFRKWFVRHRPAAEAGRRGKVLLLDDCFTTFYEPQIGRSAVKVLEAAGYAVELAGLECCTRPMISKGFLAEARILIEQQAERLASRLQGAVAILGLEPSCLLTLVDEWPELAPGAATRQIAAASHLADAWLANGEMNFKAWSADCVVHGHCHQKALVGMKGTLAALRQVPQLQTTLLETGCCGMAGSFGYEKEHYDLSVSIAKLDLLPALEKNPDALIVAPGTSCRHQIKDLTKRVALHPVEVLAKALQSSPLPQGEGPGVRG